MSRKAQPPTPKLPPPNARHNACGPNPTKVRGRTDRLSALLTTTLRLWRAAAEGAMHQRRAHATKVYRQRRACAQGRLSSHRQ